MHNEEEEEENWNMGRKKKIECNIASYSFPPVIFLLEIVYEWIWYIKTVQ